MGNDYSWKFGSPLHFIIINNCLEPHIDSADPNYLIRFMETKQTLNKMIKVTYTLPY